MRLGSVDCYIVEQDDDKGRERVEEEHVWSLLLLHLLLVHIWFIYIYVTVFRIAIQYLIIFYQIKLTIKCAKLRAPYLEGQIKIRGKILTHQDLHKL